MLPVGIGDAIRARRERAGLTQEALAALLGVHPDAVDDWEWGEGAPDPERARRLAVILDLPEGSLLPSLSSPGEPAVLVLLEPPAGEAPRSRSRLPVTNLISVPPRPAAPPPLPPGGGIPPRAVPVPAAVDPSARRQPTGPARGPAGPRSPFRLLVGGLVAALLVSVAAVSGVAAYRQGQVAAAREAEARALRNTLVVLAGERDRLAARIVELTGVLAEAGFGAAGDGASLP